MAVAPFVPTPRVALTKEQHRQIASGLFNYTWSLLERKRRTASLDDEMLEAAHASRFHWGHAGTPLNLSIAEWQVSRVYSVLGRGEPALFHAGRALAIARRFRLTPFYLAYAYEAMARAASVAERKVDRDRFVRQARRTSARVRDPSNRRMLLADLRSIP